MYSIGLSVYQFTVRERRKQNPINLSYRVDDKDIIDLLYSKFEEFLRKQQTIRASRHNQEHSGAESVNSSQGSMKKAFDMGRMIDSQYIQKDGRNFYQFVYFTIWFGEYGVRAKIVDTHTGEEVFNQEPNHAGMRPFHVYVAMNCDPETRHGMIIMEQIGRSGVKTVIEPAIKSFFANQTPSLTFSESPIAPLEYINRLIDMAEISSLRLIKYFENEDNTDKPFCEREERLFVRPAAEKLRSTLRNIANGKSAVGTNIARIDNFHPDRVKLTLEREAGKTKTIELTNIDNIGFTECYTTADGLIFDPGNLVTDDSLLKVLNKLTAEYIEIISG